MALTAKEKAEELVNKMRMPHYWQGALMYGHETHEAKESALICVDEIINVIETMPRQDATRYYRKTEADFWQSVKEEISKL